MRATIKYVRVDPKKIAIRPLLSDLGRRDKRVDTYMQAKRDNQDGGLNPNVHISTMLRELFLVTASCMTASM